MSRDAAPSADHDLPAAMRAGVMRAFFQVCAIVFASGVGLVLLVANQLLPAPKALATVGFSLLCLASVYGLRLRSASRQCLVMRAMVFSAILLSFTAGLLGGRGLAAPALVFYGLAVAILCAVDRRAWGVIGAAVAAAALLVLASAEFLGLLALPSVAAPLPVRLFVLLATLGIGAALGLTLAHLMQRYATAVAWRENRFESLLAMAASAYFETDAALRLTRVDRSTGTGALRPRQDMLGQLPWQLAGLAGDPAAAAQLQSAMQAHQPLRGLVLDWPTHAQGVLRLAVDAQPRLDDQGGFAGYWGVVRNVTDELRARAAHEATLASYKTLFNAVPTPLSVHYQGRFIDANEAAARVLGYDSVQQMIGVDALAAHIHPDDMGQAQQRLQLLAADQGVQHMPLVERRMLRRDGTPLYARLAIARVEHGGLPAVLVTMVDETERRQAMLARARSEALLARVVSASPDVITLTHAATGRYVMVNDSFCRALGYRSDEVIGRSAGALGVWQRPGDRERLMRAIERDGQVSDMAADFVAADGRQVQLLLSATRFDDEGEAYLLINARDVSQASRERLEREAILANASIGIAFTRDRRFVLANTRFEQLFGWPEGSLVGQAGNVVWCSDEDYQEIGVQHGPALARGERVVIEREVQRRDGSRFTVRFWARAIDLQRPRDGGTVWIAEDVTREREAAQELARARDAAETANRAKSRFLANTSHELRTPLNGLLGLSRLAQQPGIDPARLQRYLAQMADSAQNLSAIISDILDFSKIEAGKLELDPAPMDLGALLHTLQQSHAAQAAEKGLSLQLELQAQPAGWVLGDALRLRQVLANLLGNALKFTARGGVRLVLQRARPPGDAAPAQAGQPWWQLAVHDTGIGIDDEARARLFQPFTQADASTTRRFGGTGLGLSICRELAALMGGHIGVHSRPGQGSCFSLVLPLPDCADPTGAVVPTAPASLAALQGARVLVVEDNPVNMMVTVALLEHWGVQVTQATQGHQALQAVAQAVADGRPFQAVLMDLQMPGLGGVQATRLLRAEHDAQALPIIALTAAALDAQRDQAAAAGMNGFLSKPLEPEKLADLLARILSGPRQASSGAPDVI